MIKFIGIVAIVLAKLSIDMGMVPNRFGMPIFAGILILLCALEKMINTKDRLQNSR